MPTTLEQNQYGFDRDSRRTWQRRPLTDTQDLHHEYYALSQVTQSARGSLNLNTTAISAIPALTESWDYDPTGNWRGYGRNQNGTGTVTQHRVHDRGNRLMQISGGSVPEVLDRVGRVRQSAPSRTGDWRGWLELEWDAWSRITHVKNNGSTVGDYTYDGLTRRTTREVSSVTLHSYYSDAWRPLEERKNAETTAAMSYLWGARHRDDLVRRDRAASGTTLNETRYVLMDYFNAAAITDEEGEVKERYAYSAFGIRSILNPDYSVRTTSESAFEFGFQGQFLDGESGLMNYGYRYYSPYLGRWMCKDPIGIRGGLNLYANVRNGPVNWVDYLGLSKPFYFTSPHHPDYSTPADVDVKPENLCDCEKAGTITVTISRKGEVAGSDTEDVEVTIDGRHAPINSQDGKTIATKGKTLDMCPEGAQSGTIEIELTQDGAAITISGDAGNNNPGKKMVIEYDYTCEKKGGGCKVSSAFKYTEKISE